MSKVPLHTRVEETTKDDMDEVRNKILLPHESQEDYIDKAIATRNDKEKSVK